MERLIVVRSANVECGTATLEANRKKPKERFCHRTKTEEAFATRLMSPTNRMSTVPGHKTVQRSGPLVK